MIRTQREPKLSPRMQAAVDELKRLVREHYPDATFRVVRSAEAPRIVHLWATVDVADIDEVLDVVIDRVTELQSEEHLPVHVIPVRPRERALEIMRQQEEARKKGPHQTGHEHGGRRYGT